MKKIIAIIAFSILAANTAFAASNALQTMAGTSTGLSVYGDVTTGNAATGGTLIGKTSTGVAFGGKTGTGGYAITTQHKSGSRAIGGAFDSTSLVYQDAVPGVYATSPTVSSFSAFDTGWSSL